MFRFSSLRFIDTSLFRTKKLEKSTSSKTTNFKDDPESGEEQGPVRADVADSSPPTQRGGILAGPQLKDEWVETPPTPLQLEEMVRAQCLHTRQILLQRLVILPA